MRRSILAFALLALAAGTAEAQGRGKGNGNGNKVPPGLAKKGGLPPGQAKKLYRADDGVVVLRDVFGRNGYTVVRTVPEGDRRFVYYRGADGVVRRAVVAPGEERPSFTNVPRAVLEQIWSRLY
ncbi:hypothetical protein [Roseisolibacter sp. H3M3-2]|uniref:hypothetical protein n=1 Tax=Roseisolibacter sp. H3M3-2 TaxID=3031323 RepID=UPI0023D9A0A8|nr:hypothetical protein [Roseisolibacter sp. H3M3-2]MDF1501699.1 hypothetical protein [Roseisolibacter sp. H3M3-2]